MRGLGLMRAPIGAMTRPILRDADGITILKKLAAGAAKAALKRLRAEAR
jgi:hypothetical protein